MSKMSRIIDIWLYINKKQKFTAKELANAFNVSERTILRDLIELTEMGVPFYSEVGRNGGYVMLHNEILPPISFTEEETASIIFTYESLKQFHDIPYEAEIDSVINKLLSQVSEHLRNKLEQIRKHIFMKMPVRHEKSDSLKAIFQASIAKKALFFKYSSVDGEKDKKAVPLGIYSENGYWYFPAYDLKHDRISLFRADRVLKLYDIFDIQDIDIPELGQWFKQKYKKLEIDACTVTLRVSPKVLREFNNPIFDFSKIVWHEDGFGILTEKLSKREFPYIASVIASFGKEVKILEPIELKNILVATLNETIHLYDT